MSMCFENMACVSTIFLVQISNGWMCTIVWILRIGLIHSWRAVCLFVMPRGNAKKPSKQAFIGHRYSNLHMCVLLTRSLSNISAFCRVVLLQQNVPWPFPILFSSSTISPKTLFLPTRSWKIAHTICGKAFLDLRKRVGWNTLQSTPPGLVISIQNFVLHSSPRTTLQKSQLQALS